MNYSNSSAEQKETVAEYKAEKVVTGKVSTKKKTIWTTIGGVFGKAVKYTVNEVLVPAAKRMASESVKILADQVIYGDSGAPRDERRAQGERVSYRSYYDRDRREPERAIRRDTDIFDFRLIEFDNITDAESVLRTMTDIIKRYGWVKVFDFYDLCGITPPYTSSDYGWASLSTASIGRQFGGKYIIDFPRPMPIDR